MIMGRTALCRSLRSWISLTTCVHLLHLWHLLHMESFLKEDLFILCLWVHYCHLQTHQKRADPITDDCELPCGCWLNRWAISLVPPCGFLRLSSGYQAYAVSFYPLEPPTGPLLEYYCVHLALLCEHHGTHVKVRGQIYGVALFLYLMQVPGTDLGLQGLHCKSLYPLGPFTGPY